MDSKLAERTAGLVLYNSENDKDGIQESVKEILKTIQNIKYREFHLGHFTSGSMKSTEFPELLEELLK